MASTLVPRARDVLTARRALPEATGPMGPDIPVEDAMPGLVPDALARDPTTLDPATLVTRVGLVRAHVEAAR